MNKMIIMGLGLAILTLLVIGCTPQQESGEDTATGKPILGLAPKCNPRDYCERIAGLEDKAEDAKGNIGSLAAEIKHLQEQKPFGGCPRGVLASECTADGSSVVCRGLGGPLDTDGNGLWEETINCGSSGGSAVCTGEYPSARCSSNPG